MKSNEEKNVKKKSDVSVSNVIQKQVNVAGVIASSSEKCADKKCPFHGSLKTRGRVFEGIVIADKMRQAVTVEWPRLHYLYKFERYEKRRSKVKVRVPSCMRVKQGDKVKIAECRPLSKTIKFVVIEVLK